MSTRLIGRRAVLRGFAGVAIALPLLEGCTTSRTNTSIGKSSLALDGAGARRFVGIMVPNGVFPADWYPAANALTLGRSLAPLERHRENLLLFRNVDNTAAARTPSRPGHVEGVSSLLSGVAPVSLSRAGTQWVGGGISLDQAIANAMETAGIVTQKKSLELGPFDSDGYGAIAHAAAERPLPGYADPKTLFNVLFPQATPDTLDTVHLRRGRQKSILDGCADDLDRISRRVGKADKTRIDEHLESLRNVEKRIDAVSSCSPGNFTPPVSFGNDGEIRKAFLDIVVLAMACDITRVATFAWHRSGAVGPAFPWLGFPDDLHEITHQVVPETFGTATTYREKLIRILAFFAEQHAYFIDGLKRVSTPDGSTLFDHTVILQGSDISWNHGVDNIPFLVAAGAKTPLRGGRMISAPAATPHNNLLVTLLHAFGIQASSFGDPSVCTGDLDALLLS